MNPTAIELIFQQMKAEYPEKDEYPTIGLSCKGLDEPEEICLTDKTTWKFIDDGKTDWIVIREVRDMESDGKTIDLSCIYAFRVGSITCIREI